jgi:hypothetical protein
MAYGLGFRVKGLQLMVCASGFLGFRVQDLGFTV